jgi:hypothetical protein
LVAIEYSGQEDIFFLILALIRGKFGFYLILIFSSEVQGGPGLIPPHTAGPNRAASYQFKK